MLQEYFFWTDVYGTQTSESGEAMDKSCMVKTQLWIPSAVQIAFRCEAIVVVSSKCPPFVSISRRELYFTLRTDSFLPHNHPPIELALLD